MSMPLNIDATLHFFLFPDRTSARAARRAVAEHGGAAGLVVGTWQELLERAREAYLLPEPRSPWQDALESAAGELSGSFWNASLAVAPGETIETVSSTLALLLEGAGPSGRLTIPADGILPSRAHRHLRDLGRLHERMGFLLPPHLEVISSILGAGPEQAIRFLRVYRDPVRLKLDPWQEALLEKLSRDCSADGGGFAALHTAVMACVPAAKPETSLGALQRNIFGAGEATASLDPSVQCLAVRDFLEEVEVAVGMAQQALSDDPALAPSDLGFLVPDERCYLDALDLLCRRAGLPLSGLPVEKPVRDLGKEAVFSFLATRRQPPPALALAALLSSPLMPWSRETGNDLAQEAVGEGAPDLRAPQCMTEKGKRMLRLLAKRSDDAAGLAKALLRFAALLHSVEGMEVHVARALATIKRCRAELTEEGAVPWGDLMRISAPETVTGPAAGTLVREGAAVFLDHELPWRQVRHLFVLGFVNGRYPREHSVSSVFSDADFEALAVAGYAIETPGAGALRRRSHLREQIGCASQRLNLLMSRRDPFGKPLRPSQTLTYLAKVFGADEPDELVLELDREEERMKVVSLPTAPLAYPLPKRELKKDDLFLKRDLLAIHCYEDGSPKPQSPSSLDTLMVSPLAWLLSRAGLQPREWSPESLDVASKGTLAHHVFEHLFRPGQPLPSPAEVRAQVPILLDQAIERKKPLLLEPEWHVERRHLAKEVEVAALHWRGLLDQIGAEVLGNEVWLKGVLDTLPIHGSADLLLRLPGGQLYVVDYKKAGSGQRRERMKKGYDSQASLYRLMIQTGGSKSADGALKEALEQAGEIGVVYYLMNDQTALADSSGWIDGKVAGMEELGAGISAKAMELIRERIAELRQGKVTLNHENDPEWFKSNAGITIYALDDTPLIPLFMKNDSGDAGEDTTDQVRQKGNV
ncbi:PD-(D/E)XK nuclease family protein [Geomonas nitrogeniifigens]|uniref:PD-(D/E)XK nuclease family protein n=1 Tax=Geomonas diazotrophica TaxID=2843197 RepID=UPI001C2B7BC2|nr:PD-(D/E)XK nuclease family protein [Geomonas nitrogeniifigens]QXE85553.1 PD-(D/E)XK nuclease family protein [Geomonas nitrogeniifigens]